MPAPVVAEAFADGEAADLTPSGGPDGLLPQVVPWNDTVMLEAEPAPPLVPGLPRMAADGTKPMLPERAGVRQGGAR